MKYLATDLDGTLLEPKLKHSYVSKENKDIVELFKKNVIIISGRNPLFVKKVCKELNIKETFVASNGSSIYLNGKEIVSLRHKKEFILRTIEYIKTHFNDYKIVVFDSSGKIYSISDDTEKNIAIERKYKKESPKTSYITIKNKQTIKRIINKDNEITKINIVMSEDKKKELCDYLSNIYPNLCYSISRHCLEITPAEGNKGDALIKLTKAMKLKNEDVYVIGDDYNDLSMFKCYHNSFLVKNEFNKELESQVLHPLNKFKDLKYYIKED